jgi:uncharacterized protein YqiB (DUF1249 family)
MNNAINKNSGQYPTGNRKKYVPNLKGFHALCEANYMCMLKLLPDMDVESQSYEFGTDQEMQYKIRIVEASRYTTTLDVSQKSDSLPAWLKPSMQVRLYHDARMAEVLSSQNVSAIKPSYDYPNQKMHQKNEKEMTNSFLAEWLLFCLKHKADLAV